MLICTDKLVAHPDTAPVWLLEPYLPREGIVFLYGKKGVGKSPLTWAMSQAVATGASDGIFTVKSTGQVLYVEVDSPLPAVKLRAPRVLSSPNAWFCFPRDPLICLPRGSAEIQRECQGLKPALVVFNTLRKIHPWDDKVSETPSKVYGAMRAIWPEACLLFVHHEKKDPTERYYSPGEEYSGSLAWHNDAQVALRLAVPRGRPFKDEGSAGTPFTLFNTGNQLGAKASPMRLVLAPDGATFHARE